MSGKKACQGLTSTTICSCPTSPAPMATREQKALERLKRAALVFRQHLSPSGVTIWAAADLEKAAIAYARAVAAKEKGGGR